MNIKQIHSIDEAALYFDVFETLGVFDIDDTLLMPADPAFHKPNLKKCAAIKTLKEQLPVDHQDLISNFVLMSSASQLIESNSPLFIQDLQRRGVRLMALTAAMTRQFGEVYIPQIRYEELKNNGIDFSLGFPTIDHHSFTDIKMCNQGYPAYYSGVLCSNGDYQRHKDATPKGEVLCAFLRKAAWMPSKVVFIDDKLYNLEEMARALHHFDPRIVYQGLHYFGVHSVLSPSISEELLVTKWKELFTKANYFYPLN